MRLTDLLLLLEPGPRVRIMLGGVDVENDPYAELVADDAVDKLRLFAVGGYQVEWLCPEGDKLLIVVQEAP